MVDSCLLLHKIDLHNNIALRYYIWFSKFKNMNTLTSSTKMMNTNDVLLMLYRKIMSADEFFISRTLIKMNGDLKFKYMLIIIIYRWRQHRSVFSIHFHILNKFDWASSLMNYILFNDRSYFRKKKIVFFYTVDEYMF